MVSQLQFLMNVAAVIQSVKMAAAFENFSGATEFHNVGTDLTKTQDFVEVISTF